MAGRPAAEIYLHFAARAEHIERTIQPALARGDVVISDRFADSTMAYQGYGLGADRNLIAALCRLLPVRPGLTVILEVSPGVAAQRIAARDQALDRYEAMDAAFHARVAAGFAAIAADGNGALRRHSGRRHRGGGPSCGPHGRYRIAERSLA